MNEPIEFRAIRRHALYPAELNPVYIETSGVREEYIALSIREGGRGDWANVYLSQREVERLIVELIAWRHSIDYAE